MYSDANQAARPHASRLSVALVIVGMVVGSVGLWIGNPVFWLWITGRWQSTQPSMTPYGALLLGILATAIGCAKALGALNRRYLELTGNNTVIVHLPWARGLGGEHERKLVKVTVLDVVMVLSVVVAAIALAAWFIIVKPTPPGVGPGGFKH